MAKIDLSSINKKHVKPVPKQPIKHIEKVVKAPEKVPQPVIKAPKVKAPKPAKEVKEEPKKVQMTELDRQKSIKLLELYILDFPEELAKYKNINFNKCNDAKLVEYKEEETHPVQSGKVSCSGAHTNGENNVDKGSSNS